MKLLNVLPLLAGGLFVLTACSKEKEGTNSSSGNVEFQLESVNSGRMASGGKTESHYLDWTDGQASVSEIKLEVKGENKMEYKSTFPQVIDLGNAVSSLGNISIPFGTYQKIEFKIKFVPTANTPALELNGDYTTAAGVTVPVIIRINQPFELKFEKKTPTTIDANTNYAALSTLALDSLSHIITQTALSTAVQTNGTILISSTSNTQIYNPFWTTFQTLLKTEIKKK